MPPAAGFPAGGLGGGGGRGHRHFDHLTVRNPNYVPGHAAPWAAHGPLRIRRAPVTPIRGRAGARTGRSAAPRRSPRWPRRPFQGVQRAQEPPVRLVAPADVARAAPAGGPQRVEPAVIADPGEGVPVDRVGRDLGQVGPGLQAAAGPRPPRPPPPPGAGPAGGTGPRRGRRPAPVSSGSRTVSGLPDVNCDGVLWGHVAMLRGRPGGERSWRGRRMSDRKDPAVLFAPCRRLTARRPRSSTIPG